ncbi:hypothetical protein CLF_104154 [Clonorchis sinensis]|uniref:Uncharacterized protein n=1 Tax=Clonorchis sinensis TaxID=79923 RepID=G7YB38_CLOSI|nr:hypothetical protein CLF_104154 [Clonorchis sinensis]
MLRTTQMMAASLVDHADRKRLVSCLYLINHCVYTRSTQAINLVQFVYVEMRGNTAQMLHITWSHLQCASQQSSWKFEPLKCLSEMTDQPCDSSNDAGDCRLG